MNQKIELTEQELEDCKREAADDAVFRYKVRHDTKILFKILNGLPEKVAALWTQNRYHWILLIVLFGILAGIFLRK